MSAVHPDMMYNHDNWDFICYFGDHFVLQFWKGKTKNRAWHGTDLESAYPNCVRTTAWQIVIIMLYVINIHVFVNITDNWYNLN